MAALSAAIVALSPALPAITSLSFGLFLAFLVRVPIPLIGMRSMARITHEQYPKLQAACCAGRRFTSALRPELPSDRQLLPPTEQALGESCRPWVMTCSDRRAAFKGVVAGPMRP